MWRFLAILITVLLTPNTPAPQPATITVHMINARTGKPIPHKPVRMWLIDGGPPYRLRSSRYSERTTSDDGTAVFDFRDPQLSGPVPYGVLIHSGMGGYWEDCTPNDRANFELGQVLSSGVSREGDCAKLPKIDNQFHAKPGEVYLFAVHLTLWEKLRQSEDGFPW